MSYRIAGWIIGTRHRLFHRHGRTQRRGICSVCVADAFIRGMRDGFPWDKGPR